MEVHGVPEYVIVNGRVCVDECELKAVHGFGKFVETPTFCNYVYDMIEEREKVYILFVNKIESRKSMYIRIYIYTLIPFRDLEVYHERKQKQRSMPRRMLLSLRLGKQQRQQLQLLCIIIKQTVLMKVLNRNWHRLIVYPLYLTLRL